MVKSVRVIKKTAISVPRAHQSRGMVEQHANGNFFIPRIQHDKVGQVERDGFIQIQLTLIHKQHHRNGCKHFAGGTNSIDGIFRDRQGVVFIKSASGARDDDLIIIKQVVLQAIHTIITHEQFGYACSRFPYACIRTGINGRRSGK